MYINLYGPWGYLSCHYSSYTIKDLIENFTHI